MSEHCPRIKLILGKFHSDEEDREEEKKKTGNNIQPCCINGLVNLRIYYNQMNKRDFSCMTRTWYLRQARQADLASLGTKPEHRICFTSPSLKLVQVQWLCNKSLLWWSPPQAYLQTAPTLVKEIMFSTVRKWNCQTWTLSMLFISVETKVTVSCYLLMYTSY